MSERKPKSFYELDSAATSDLRRQNTIKKAIGAGWAKLPLPQRYHLLTHAPFENLVPPDLSDQGLPRQRPRAPEPPVIDEELRLSEARALQAAYDQRKARFDAFCEEYCQLAIEVFNEIVEALTSDGEYWPEHLRRRSRLQWAEEKLALCPDIPVYCAVLMQRKKWHKLLPPVPTLPPGSQTSLF